MASDYIVRCLSLPLVLEFGFESRSGLEIFGLFYVAFSCTCSDKSSPKLLAVCAHPRQVATSTRQDRL